MGDSVVGVVVELSLAPLIQLRVPLDDIIHEILLDQQCTQDGDRLHRMGHHPFVVLEQLDERQDL